MLKSHMWLVATVLDSANGMLPSPQVVLLESIAKIEEYSFERKPESRWPFKGGQSFKEEIFIVSDAAKSWKEMKIAGGWGGVGTEIHESDDKEVFGAH